MKIDILIKNGHIVDPARGIDAVGEIAVCGGKIVDLQGEIPEPAQTINADGCYVFPGLIDYHTHIFYGGTALGACPDFMLSTGVTAAVDAGSAGSYTFPVFQKNVIANSNVRIKAFVSCYPMGLGGERVQENFDPKFFDESNLRHLFNTEKDAILGLKMRISRGLIRDLEPLRAAVALAERLGNNVPLCVHITDPAGSMDEVMELMRPGDIVCHVYEGTGNTILDENNSVLPSVRAARDRGVIFDVANGKMNFSVEVCQRAMEQGFLPDVISTDMSVEKIHYGARVRTLPFVMSKFLSLGMSLTEVIRRTTEIPAALMGLQGEIGTLRPGSRADICICKLVEREVMHYDTNRVAFRGRHLLIPQMTVVDGKIAFGQIDFSLPEEDIENLFAGKRIK